jgi:ubiquinone/menaquinone biosynthesis C-methylase UbiE
VSSYVYMKVLESAPERYDRGIDRLSGGHIQEIYDAVAERVAAPGKDVLDIGSGTGGVALACAARGAHVVGIDQNPGMLGIAREKAAKQTLSGSMEWVELGAMEIEDRFAEKSLDAVVSCLVMSELVPEERRYVLGVVLSRLKDGGRVVFADEVPPLPGARRLWSRARRLPAAIWTYLWTQTTTRQVEGLADLVREAGFSEVSETRIGDDFAIVDGTKP